MKCPPHKVIVACFAFALCAWTPKAAHREIRSIGVIAAVGDICMFEHVTDSSLDWIRTPQATFLEISDWGLDDVITAEITKLLGAHYRLQPIAIEHQNFDTWTWNSLRRHIRELPIPEKPVDAYLLVLRNWHRDEIGGSTHPIVGLGLYHRDVKGGFERVAVFASYRLALLDPDTGNVIAERAAILPGNHIPWLPASATLWPRTQNELTKAQRQELDAEIKKLIGASLPSVLRELLH